MDDLTLQAIQSFNNSLANNANVIMASQTSKADRKFSERMSNLAWERNLEAWRMQNEYNLPSNVYARQLEGLRVNGLNPNLVYGGSSSVSGAAGSVSPYKLEGYHSTAVPQFRGDNGILGLLNTRLLQTQIAAAEANNRLINARAANEESRNPGILAKSNEASYRWNLIRENLLDNYDEAVRGTLASEYWKGVKSQNDAELSSYQKQIKFYDAVTAEWLNTTEAPGTGMTYRQYMEHCRAFLPGAQYDKLKSDVLNIASEISYRAQQGELLELKQEFQRYVNRLARYGRSLGNDWITLLISGLQEIFPSLSNLGFNLPTTERPKDAYERGMAEHPAHNY